MSACAHNVLHPCIAETRIFDRLAAFADRVELVPQPLLSSSLFKLTILPEALEIARCLNCIFLSAVSALRLLGISATAISAKNASNDRMIVSASPSGTDLVLPKTIDLGKARRKQQRIERKKYTAAVTTYSTNNQTCGEPTRMDATATPI